MVFQGAIDTWSEDAERSCGVTLFADSVFEKSLLWRRAQRTSASKVSMGDWTL